VVDQSGFVVMTDEDFGPVVQDNEALINQDEQEHLEEQKFIMAEDEAAEMNPTGAVSFAVMNNTTTNDFNQTSKTNYFSKNTSR
jgi:hypothetical protein